MQTDDEKAERNKKKAESKRRQRASKKETLLADKLTHNLNSSPFPRSQERGKCLKQTRGSLKGSNRQKKEVLKTLLEEIESVETVSYSNKSLPLTTLNKVKEFYMDDDISRSSPNSKDVITIKKKGTRRCLSVKHMMYPIKEVHGMFLKDNPQNNPGIKISLQKFVTLRPPNVLSFLKFPHNICVCELHENLRCGLKVIRKAHGNLADIHTDNGMHLNFVCEQWTSECFSNNCEECHNAARIKERVIILEDPLKEVEWFKWVKTSKNRSTKEDDDQKIPYCNVEKSKQVGSITQLLDDIYKQSLLFLPHQYVKMSQSTTSKQQINLANQGSSNVAVVPIDFAEKFKVIQQNATQSSNYGQIPITILTAGVYHRGFQSLVIASDSEKQTKDSVVVYVDVVLCQLATTVKTVHIWSDNATSQFKNQCIMKKHKIKITWNFFAAMHGKSVVDGIGGSIKRLVRNKIKGHDLIIRNAKDFAKCATGTDIKVISMKQSDINERNLNLKIAEIFRQAKKLEM